MAADSRGTGHANAGVLRGLAQLYRALTHSRRRQLFLVLALMIAGAVAELATIGAVLPFLTFLARPGSLGDSALFQLMGAASARDRLLTATALFAVVAMAAGIIRLRLTWSTQRFAFGVGHDLAVEIQRRVLHQPYMFHVSSNTSSLVAALEKVPVLVMSLLLQVMQAGTAAFIAMFVVGALVAIDPTTAVLAAVGFGVIYSLVSALARGRLAENNAIVGRSYDERVKIVQESLGGIRDVLIEGSQQVYLEEFRKTDDRFSAARASTMFIMTAPRFAIEAAGMIVIAVIAVMLSMREGGIVAAIPILGALALGAQRLLPLMQQIYGGWSAASAHGSILTQVLDLLRLPMDERISGPAGLKPLLLTRSIVLQDVTFAYPTRRSPAVQNVSLEIPRGSTVALVGRTGSGKSTLADLIMGLIQPKSGSILIDGLPLTDSLSRRWQLGIAHVPQSIFLADDSIARNIAFTVAANAVDRERVIEAAVRAQLHEFVMELEDGYDTPVGERGVRLSGGQRQRLAIARAIYKQAPVLILDEATASLDDATEAAVLSALQSLANEGRTIVMIAHRLSTIQQADYVIRLENGRVVDVEPPATGYREKARK
jgi:ABC-type multidrug transport system fused ATPase/permease subunit